MRRIRYLAPEVASNHRQGTARQIAQPVGQVRVIALYQRIERKRSVLAENDFAQQEITQSIRAQHVENRLRAYNVAARLRHLAFFKEQPAVRHDGLRQFQTCGHQESRPVDAVEAHNLFADHVHIRRPILFERPLRPGMRRSVANRRNVVGQRIQPHVNHVLGIVRYRNAPRKCRAADGEIAQPRAHERDHFIAPRFRPNEVGIRVDFQQLVLKRRELEEVILFMHGLGDPAAVGAWIARLYAVHVHLVGDAVLAGVRALVDVAVVANAAE